MDSNDRDHGQALGDLKTRETVADLFATSRRPDEQLHPGYRTLRDSPLLAPARDLLAEMLRRLPGPDGTLADEFQTTGFESRMFELLLIGMFSAAGHTVDIGRRGHTLLLKKSGISATVAVLTAGEPSPNAPGICFAQADGDQVDPGDHHLRHGISMRLADSLLQQLRKRNGALPSLRDRPIVLAIQDLRMPTGSANPSVALSHFLFGHGQRWRTSSEGQLVIDDHCPTDADDRLPRDGSAGLFRQPGAAHLSAVLFCGDNELVSKFNRLGQEGTHRCDAVRMLRYGTCLRGIATPNTPEPFAYEVGENGVARESWNEGTVLIHNPCARHPLPRGWLGASAEEEFKLGTTSLTLGGAFHPFTSVTEMLPGNTPSWWIEQRAHLVATTCARQAPAHSA